jgi:UDP-GlcNAc3NAcA epimerase
MHMAAGRAPKPVSSIDKSDCSKAQFWSTNKKHSGQLTEALHVTTIVGARPQFVKASVVSRAIRERQDIDESIIHTGQHYDENLSGIFFEELGIPAPNYHLGIGSLPHGAQTGRMLEAIEKLLLQTNPDWVLVYGDTNSTLAGALAASKLHIPVAHIEAGLRSYNRNMPEEINRIVVDHLSELLFVPSARAELNLRQEGIGCSKVRLVGDVMFDAALFYAELSERRSDILNRLALSRRGYILATVHRAENTDDKNRLRNIVEALIETSRRLPVVIPLHPRTRASLKTFKLFARLSQHVNIIDPLGYLDMVMLQKHSSVILTDSGGVQKEAYFFGVPCVTLRDETEWAELVEAGVNRLASPVSVSVICKAVEDSVETRPNNEGRDLYGNGHSALDIVNALLEA